MIVACCPWCGAEYSVTDTRCWDCKLSLVDRPDPTLAEGTDVDDVGFELEEWSAGERGRLSAGLRERGIAFRWEPGLTLVVAAADEDLVDSLLDAMESSDRVGRLRGADDDDFEDDDDEDDDDEESDGGERAHAAMGDLFVAADRLIQRPDDGRIAEQLVAATLIVQDSRAPYGFEPVAWLQIRELASAALEAVESDAGDESVSREARTLRDALRPYI
ncbi:MAG: hypothetical protein QOG43_503 [Actinomycetota bacterium]|jgi:hypothetical protein|nr:hypothetical protein [Actinomycetota bacterium]